MSSGSGRAIAADEDEASASEEREQVRLGFQEVDHPAMAPCSRVPCGELHRSVEHRRVLIAPAGFLPGRPEIPAQAAPAGEPLLLRQVRGAR